MVAGQLRVAVIGSQTQHADTPLAYTLYRTAVNYRGVCHHRLIRYRHFLAFAKKVKPPVRLKLPPKIWWSRKASLHPETVEARQVLLNEFMQQVCTKQLTPKSEERLMRLLHIGDYTSDDDVDVEASRFAKQPSLAPTERASDVVELAARNVPTQIAEAEDADPTVEVAAAAMMEKTAHRASLDDELPRHPDDDEPQGVEPGHHDPEVSMEPAGIEAEEESVTRSRALSAPLTPPLQVMTRPFSLSLSTQNLKRVMFEPKDEEGQPILKEEAPEPTGSSEYASTPERRYFGEIKKHILSIEELLDSSRKLEMRILEKQVGNGPSETLDGPTA
ncbi:hypothetical protein BBJ28_00011583 [Nothophytophthora sp. Chile5]|nr:hypothetical protein BBJ28_00011583 [Nothophytophthora sp. Chile5]